MAKKTPAPAQQAPAIAPALRKRRQVEQVARPKQHGVGARSTQPAPPAPEPAKPARPQPIKVRATKLRYYNMKRRRVNDVYVLRKESHFDPKTMVRVNPTTPEKVTGPNAHIEREKLEILGLRQGDKPEIGMIVGPDESSQVGEGDPNPIDE
jgi:hypothetical protein